MSCNGWERTNDKMTKSNSSPDKQESEVNKQCDLKTQI